MVSLQLRLLTLLGRLTFYTRHRSPSVDHFHSCSSCVFGQMIVAVLNRHPQDHLGMRHRCKGFERNGC